MFLRANTERSFVDPLAKTLLVRLHGRMHGAVRLVLVSETPIFVFRRTNDSGERPVGAREHENWRLTHQN